MYRKEGLWSIQNNNEFQFSVKEFHAVLKLFRLALSGKSNWKTVPPLFSFSQRFGDCYRPVWGNTRDPVQQRSHKRKRSNDDQMEICKSQWRSIDSKRWNLSDTHSSCLNHAHVWVHLQCIRPCICPSIWHCMNRGCGAKHWVLLFELEANVTDV